MEPGTVTILLVDDDPGDQKLIRNSLSNETVANDLYTVDSGEQAFDFLYRRGNYKSGTPRPDLILLDLNMPGMGGKEFLKQIKKDDYLKTIPVIILSTSDSDKDVRDSYELHASGYVKKPLSISEFKEAMERIKEYWFLVSRRPPKDGDG
jgi:CheY-like chemotaxis protein